MYILAQNRNSILNTDTLKCIRLSQDGKAITAMFDFTSKPWVLGRFETEEQAQDELMAILEALKEGDAVYSGLTFAV